MAQLKMLKILSLLLLIELSVSRTVTHHKTTIDSDGDKVTKTWTTTSEGDDDDDFFKSSLDKDDGFQSYFRNGATLRIRPQTETIRIGGTNIPEEDLIKQGVAQGMDAIALRELLRTKQTVIKNSTDAKGQKRTTTYSLDDDGYITCRSVTEVSPAQVDSKFDDIFANRHGATATTTGLTSLPASKDTEWISTNTNGLRKPTFTTTFSRPAWDADSAWPTLSERPKVELPQTWNPQDWSNTNVYRTHKVDAPSFNTRSSFDVPVTRNEPTNFSHKTVHTTFETSTPLILPSLDDFLREQYAKPGKELTREPTTPRTHRLVPTKQININDLPAMEVINNGHNQPSDLRPLVGPQTPIRTIKVENIPRRESIETTNIKSLTKTINTNSVPSAVDLDPQMLEILRNANIDPADIKSINGDSITKTRTEPDGRVITTTYRVRLVPSSTQVTQSGAAEIPATQGVSTGIYELIKPLLTPISTTTLPTIKHVFREHTTRSSTPNTANRRAIQATEFDDDDDTDTDTDGDDENEWKHPKTINPLHLHPIDADMPPAVAKAGGNHKIKEFLAKIGLNIDDILNKNGELIKTIVEDDGTILTARFVVSTVKDGKEATKRKEIKPIK